jgi:hypothetical protein
MTTIEVGDLVIIANSTHGKLGRVTRVLKNDIAIYNILVSWHGSHMTYNYRNDELTLITREDYPEYFI